MSTAGLRLLIEQIKLAVGGALESGLPAIGGTSCESSLCLLILFFKMSSLLQETHCVSECQALVPFCLHRSCFCLIVMSDSVLLLPREAKVSPLHAFFKFARYILQL